MADFYRVFHDLFDEVAITNRQLMERYKEREGVIYMLLLRQQAALRNAMDEYVAIMRAERQEKESQ